MSLPGWMTNRLTSLCLTADSVAFTILVSVIGKQVVLEWTVVMLFLGFLLARCR